ncbi:hypothetical protein BDW22DRAFT_1353761 [Trametopsis cervina]|nr:hypothetical protein BDW22DRAFT_1353761 [Trametopsis cervina]
MYPLAVSTNIPRQAKLPLITSNKAAPTVQVSFSNANAQRDLAPTSSISHNCIPFPSQPIQCARISPAHTEQNFERIDTWSVVDSSIDTRGDDSDVFYVASKSPFGSSFAHRNTLLADICSRAHAACTPIDVDEPIATTGPRKRKMAVKRVKVPSLSPKGAKRPKRSKSVKKHTADVQFTAILHRSILAHLRNIAFSSPPTPTRRGVAPYDSSSLQRQDQLLVERLWKSLLDQGFSPLPLSLLADDVHIFGISHDRVDHVFQTEPIVLGFSTDSPMDVDSDRSQALSAPSPAPAPSCGDAEVFGLPHLVASLTLRYRDRSSTRSRSHKGPFVIHRPARSPLSTVVQCGSTGSDRR